MIEDLTEGCGVNGVLWPTIRKVIRMGRRNNNEAATKICTWEVRRNWRLGRRRRRVTRHCFFRLRARMRCVPGRCIYHPFGSAIDRTDKHTRITIHAHAEAPTEQNEEDGATNNDHDFLIGIYWRAPKYHRPIYAACSRAHCEYQIDYRTSVQTFESVHFPIIESMQ